MKAPSHEIPSDGTSPVKKGEVVLLGVVILLGAALRAAYLKTLLGWVYVRELLLVGDGRVYHDAATHMLRQGPWAVSVSYQDPFYPMLLASFMKLTGSDLAGPLVVQCAFGLLGAILVWAIARRMAGPLAGLVAGALVALSPVPVYYEGLMEKSALCIFFMVLSVWLLAGGIQKGGCWRLAAAGTILALAALLRANILLMLPVALIMIGMLFPPRKRRSAATLAFLAGLLFIFVPVMVRNHVILGDWALTAGQGGANFWIGNNPRNQTGSFWPPPFLRHDPRFEEHDWKAEAERRSGRQLSRGEVSRFWLREGLSYWVDSPLSAAHNAARKAALFLSKAELPDTHAYPFFRDRFAPLRLPLPGMGPVVAFASVGFVFSLGCWRSRATELALFGAYALSVVSFFVLGRYRIVALPFFAAFAGVGVANIVRLAKERKLFALAAAFGLLVAGFFLTNRGEHPETYAFPHFNLAAELVEEGRYEEAERQLQAGLDKSPLEPLGLELKGDLALERGDLGEAEQALSLALQREPGRTSIRWSLSRLREKQGRWEEALSLTEALVREDPFNPRFKRRLKALRAVQSRE
jgi:4-amino-4-deoxy-L-arabinose transferase-like glycosyltransferase